MDIIKDFNEHVISLPEDYEGKVIATLVSAKANTHHRDSILYIHGFVDYFFQTHMAETFINRGYDFYALDLRKYGRSLLPHQHPNYSRSMKEYFPEISLSLKIIREQNLGNIILMGHSTGGLITSLYLNEGVHKDFVSRLILNSPFFDFNLPKLKKYLLPALAAFRSSLNEYSFVEDALNRVYAQSIHKESHGEWVFNTKWKPLEGFPTYYAWISAVSKAQKRIRNHSNISVPVLVLHSDKSLNPKTVVPESFHADTVLNVKDIARIGAKLGPHTTIVEIKNGMHDLVLSEKPVREKVFEEIFNWLDKKEPF